MCDNIIGMEKETQEEQQKDKQDKKYSELDDALGEFDEENKLNLTGGDKEGTALLMQRTCLTRRFRRSTRSS